VPAKDAAALEHDAVGRDVALDIIIEAMLAG
jgi:hypothetical protein